jgi:hypothetical protein
MNGQYSFDGFQFEDDLPFHNEVDSVPTIKRHIFVDNR